MRKFAILIVLIISMIFGITTVSAEDFPGGFLPPFGYTAISGSSVSGSQIGSLITDASTRNIGATADFPSGFNYAINAQNVIGSVNAFMNVHAQGGFDESGVKASDFVYMESDTATGFVSSFVKSMSFQAG